MRFDMETYVKKLEEKDFDKEAIQKILEVTSRLPIFEEFENIKIDGGECLKINIVNTMAETPKKGDILLNGFFNCKVDGVDPNRIISVELPKLTIEKVEKLKVKLEVLPFAFDKYSIGNSK